MTSLEGRVLRRRAAIAPPEGARSELWIMRELADRLGSAGTWSVDPAEVFDELARASEGGLADYSGLSHALLDTGLPAFWPYPSGSTGTPRLFLDSFAHADGLARLVAVRPRVREEPAQVEGTLTLVTGRLLEHYQSGSQTRRVPELAQAQPRARVQVHPATAARLGIAHGAPVRVANARGAVECIAEVTTDIRHDTVFLPFHFAGAECANLLTRSVTDPISGMPEFKHTTVTLSAMEVARA